MKCLPAGPLPACRNHLLLACMECNQCAAWRLRDGKNGVSGTGSFGQIGLSETLGPYHMIPMQQSVLDGCSWEQWRRRPHLVQDLDGSSAMRRKLPGHHCSAPAGCGRTAGARAACVQWQRDPSCRCIGLRLSRSACRVSRRCASGLFAQGSHPRRQSPAGG